VGCEDRRSRLEVVDPRFIKDPKRILLEVKEHLMLKRLQPMTSAVKPHNARKYCEFHEQNGHMTNECQELRRALHELADKGQIDHFLKRGLRFLQKERELAWPEPREEECSTEIVTTITGGYAESITRST